MDEYTLSEGGIYRPRSAEETAFLRDRVLAAPVVASDFLSSISQIISPRRNEEIVGLAELIAREFEEHVDTRIRTSTELRVHRDAEEFPHRQYHLELELAYAYQLLNLLDPARYSEKYAEESLRLRKELAEKTNNFSQMPTLGFTAMLRGATVAYLSAALRYLHREVTERTTPELEGELVLIGKEVGDALAQYRAVRRTVAAYSLNDDLRDSLWSRIEESGSFEAAISILAEGTNLLNETMDTVQRGAATEHFEWLLQGLYGQHLEDILFGEIRCHALLGDYAALIGTADVLETLQTSEGYRPSRLIRESAAIVRQQAMSIRSGGSLVPFVADSSEEHAEYARSLVLSRGILQPKTAERELRWVVDTS